MRGNAVITLVAETFTQDSIGQQVASETAREVYANAFTLSATEFYAAGAEGLRPEHVYQVRSCEYAGEGKARVDGVEFDIIRVDRRGEWTRLTLGRSA